MSGSVEIRELFADGDPGRAHAALARGDRTLAAALDVQRQVAGRLGRPIDWFEERVAD